MKGTLVKREDRYDLYNESDGSKIASTAPNPQSRLSIINCESIEKGYSIEEIDALFKKVPHTVRNEEDYWKCRAGFITGFQTAMELLGDKIFTLDDIYTVFIMGREGMEDKMNRYVTRIHEPTEWDVEIEMESILENGYKNQPANTIGFVAEYKSVPKLDADGCLILKRI